MTFPEDRGEAGLPSLEGLVARLQASEPTERVHAIRALGDPRRCWTKPEEEQIARELLSLLADDRTDTFTYGMWMSDEEAPASRVCDAAAAVLVARFGDAAAVRVAFAKAHAAGHPVAPPAPAAVADDRKA